MSTDLLPSQRRDTATATLAQRFSFLENPSQATLMALIEQYALVKPNAQALVFPLETSPNAQEITWHELARLVRQYAAFILSHGVLPGDNVVVLSASVREQMLGFLGALGAGCQPTIVSYPSTKQTQAAFSAMLKPIVRHSNARLLLCADEFFGSVGDVGSDCSVTLFPSADNLPTPISAWSAHPAEKPLFLQFSSGTTGIRKAVGVTELMLMRQAAAYGKAIELDINDKVVSWLPLYHDMGLVAAFLIPLCHGITGIHISPFQWLMRPETILRYIEEYDASLLWLPNFAYDFLASQIDPETISANCLRSLRGIINCSEPIRPRTHQNFLRRFKSIGATSRHLQTCYAMAETTFAVTQSTFGQPATLDHVDKAQFQTAHTATPAAVGAADETVMTFMSCGRPIDGVQIRIRDVEKERVVGEIEVKSDFLFDGYLFNAEDKTPFSNDGWFRTGDLGYLAQGELYVTGRVKDLIIRRGENIYPTDIEEVVAGIRGSKRGRVVAFGVPNREFGTDDVVVMMERENDKVNPVSLANQAREQLLTVLNEAASDVVVCDANTLRKSTSGKLSRSANRALYLEHYANRPKLTVAGGNDHKTSQDPVEEMLMDIWKSVLGLEHIPVNARLFAELGSDSLSAMRAIGEIRKQFGQVIEPSALLREDTIERQASLLRAGDNRDADGVVACLQRGQSRTPFFLVHPAAGRAWPYITLLPYLDNDRPVYAFQAPEFFGATTFLDVEQMAREYRQRLIEIQPEGPYLIGGWSFGGLIAHALASQLIDAGHKVARLILFDTDPPPSIPVRWSYELKRTWIQHAARHKRGNGKLQDLSGCARFLNALRPETDSPLALARALHFAFPERFSGEIEQGATVLKLWQQAVQVLEARAKPEEIRPFLIPGLDAQATWLSARVLVKNRRYAAIHRPRHRYRGRIDIIAAADPARLTRWRNFTNEPPVIHEYSIRGNEVLRPHFRMFEPDNVELFGHDINTLLYQTD